VTRLLAAALLMCGCASTTVYENGQPVFRTQGDVANLTFSTRSTTLRVGSVSHSSATLAGAQAASQVINAGSALAAVVGTAVIGGVAAVHGAVSVIAAPAAAAVSAHASTAAQHANTSKTLSTKAPP
jgi:hypothetical protein